MNNMKLPDDVKPEEVIHPNGTFFRNPSNKVIRDRAKDQTSIVENIKGSTRKRTTEVLQYRPQDEPFKMPGVLKLRSLTEEQIRDMFKSLMRLRPNILKLHIKLGEYPSFRPIRDRKVDQLGSSEPRFSEELAEDFATLLADKRLLVTEVIYTVHTADQGNFSSTCEAYGVTEEEYKNDKLFTPAILLEYFPNL